MARLVEHVYRDRTRIGEVFDHPSGQVWAPSGDANDPAGYLNAVLAFMGRQQDQEVVTGGEAMALNIIKDLIPDGINQSGPRGQKARAIIWHVAEGGRAGVRSWFHNPASEASTHYLVCKNGDVINFVDEANTPWANGAVNNPRLTNPVVKDMVESGINLNRLTISIETERYTGDRLTADSPMERALAQLTREVMLRHGIPIDDDHICGHNEVDSVNRPNCPGNLDWDALLAAVKSGAVSPPAPTRPPGYLELGQKDTFDWKGEGVITYRKVRYHNPLTKINYTREWSATGGYSNWVRED